MPNKPTDFNDLAAVAGAGALGAQLVEHLRQDLEAEGDAAEMDSLAELAEEQAAISGGAGESSAVGVADDGVEWQHMLERDSYRRVKGSVLNLELILRHDERWRDVLGFCELSYRIVKRQPAPTACKELGEWGDEDAAAFRVWMPKVFGSAATPTHQDINDALLVAAKAAPFHPVRDYLAGLEWDGEPRLCGWLQKAFSATDDSRYLDIVGPKVLMAAVARVMEPGCKMDNVMILEGKQGKGKSTVVSTLFGDWFADAPIPIGDKEAYQLIHGKWAWELAELDSFNKSDVTALKQFFSQRVDRFRPSYGRYAQDHHRQTQFWGTTNQDCYLRDYTGNRRFWPVFCAQVHLDWVRENRDQLWAEAKHRYDQRAETGATWWIEGNSPPEDIQVVEDAQNSRLQRDPWEDVLREWLRGELSREGLSSATILQEAIKLDAAHMQQAHMNRLGPIMRSLGWCSKRRWVDSHGGKKQQARVWVFEEEGADNVPF